MPPVVVSLINLKGGVGKTTTTVQLAECLVSEFGKRVLVIDLDPQTNATIALIDEQRWSILNRAKQTVAQLFLDKLEKTSTFNLTSALQTSVSNLKLERLDLLPSSIEMINFQDRMSDISRTTDYSLAPMEVLKVALAGKLDAYNYVLIDCPPNLGFITRNGIEISDYYLIPTIPDTLSTYGIPQIIESIHGFASQRPQHIKIRCLGLVITKFDTRSIHHRSGLETLPARFTKAFQDRGLPPARIFNTRMPLANTYAEGTEIGFVPKTYRDKWGYTSSGDMKLHQYVTELTKEFMTHAVS